MCQINSDMKCEDNYERQSMPAICQDGESLMFIAGIIHISAATIFLLY